MGVLRRKDGKFAGSTRGANAVPTPIDPRGAEVVARLRGKRAVLHPSEDELQAAYVRFCREQEDRDIRALSSVHASEEAVDGIARASTSEMALGLAASHPHANRATLDYLAEHHLDKEAVRVHFAGNRNATPEHLTRVIDAAEAADHLGPLRTVAGRADAGDANLMRLAQCRFRAVRAHVAWNPASSGDVVEVLAHDRDAETRLGAADHPAAHPETLSRLGDPAVEVDPWIRTAARANPAYPRHIEPAPVGVA